MKFIELLKSSINDNAKCLSLLFGWILVLATIATFKGLILAVIGIALITIGCMED